MTDTGQDYDLAIVGGGLSALMTAHFWLTAHPDGRVCIVEQADALAGDHTWSFFKTDISPAAWRTLDTFARHRWPVYEVAFPEHCRRIRAEYASGDSASLTETVAPHRRAGRLTAVLGRAAVDTTPNDIVLEDGERIRAGAVLDARGRRPEFVHAGFQKFVGAVVRLDGAHGLEGPVVMDATVSQRDGYRFVYCLPYGKDELLIEDTRYTNDDGLERADYEAGVREYAAGRGWTIAKILRMEEGVLPITLAADAEAGIRADKDKAPRIGLGAGLFNATSGYSLPDAVRLAERIAALPEARAELAARCVFAYRREHERHSRFYRMLNRMMLKAAKPHKRYKILERFYRLDPKLIARFYAGRLTTPDKARILTGYPPVRIDRAIVTLDEDKLIAREGISFT